MTKTEVILEYLQHTGAKKEADMYLKLFKEVEPHRFAIIAIDAKTLAVYEKDVAVALGYLSSLGLTPIILHDATGALGKQLVSDIWTNVGKCQAIMAGLHTGTDSARSIAAKAKELMQAKTMPIVETENVDNFIKQLLQAIKPRKLVLLNKFGGVRTEKDELLSYINLPNEYDKVSEIAAAEYRPLLKTASEALAAADWKLHVEIVSPTGLLTELFTIKGSGTFIKKGPKVVKLNGSKADKSKIVQLLEKSFGKKLGSSYFGSSNKTMFFVEENYNGIAVVNKICDTYYIDKLAVLPEVQGEGLARDIITAVINSCGKIFWRAKPENHINDWYFRLCSGMQKAGDWFVYWSGLDTDEIKEAILYASEKPADFVS
ncbi:hypothetical protein HYY73_03850 [Candidatus Woesearchaeota archaeon]|nr:hypothetical protein [Candidatus Woesearchaeota archaeon]